MSKQSNVLNKRVKQISPVLLMMLLLVFDLLLEGVGQNNESQILAEIKHFWNPGWLEQDWFLSIENPYRYAFNVSFGWLSLFLSLPAVSIVSRLIAYSFLAVIFQKIAKKINLSMYWLIPILFLIIHRAQSLGAGEWVFGGIESKVIAYIFIFFGLIAFIDNKWGLLAVFIGLACSFHVLVGGYAVLSFIPALLILRKRFIIDKNKILLYLVLFVLCASVGFYTIVHNVLNSISVDNEAASQLYLMRSAHHLLPPVWDWPFTGIKIGLCVLFLLYIVKKTEKKEWHYLGIFALSSLWLFVFGLIVFFIGAESILKYYLFRFPDTIVPIVTVLLFFAYLDNRIQWLKKTRILNQRNIGYFLSIGVLIFTSLSFIDTIRESVKYNLAINEIGIEKEYIDIMHWVRNNTPQESKFLDFPMNEGFYLIAQRPVFVKYKHVPQGEKMIEEWYQRIKACNGGNELQGVSFKVGEELRNNYYNLRYEDIKNLSDTYNLDYYIGPADSDIAFEKKYSNTKYGVFKLE